MYTPVSKCLYSYSHPLHIMKCPQCTKENGYVRKQGVEWFCRNCGTVSPFKLVEKPKVNSVEGVPDVR